MTVLLVRIPVSGVVDHSSWVLIDADGRLVGEGSGLSGNDVPRCRRLCLLLPDAVLSYTQADLPDPKLRRNAAAIAYAVEDQVVEDIDGFHLTIIDPGQSGRGARVALLRRDWLSEVLRQLAERNLFPDRAIPEVLAAPLQMGTWRVLRAQTGDSLRVSSTECLPLDESAVPHVLQMTLEAARIEGRAPVQIEVTACPGREIDVSVWESKLKVPVAQATTDWRQAPGAEAPNLLQGEFRPRRRFSLAWFDFLRPVAYASMAVGMVAVLGLSVYSGRLLLEKKIIQLRMESRFKETFPDQPLTNVAVQMRRNLLGLRHQVGLQDASDLLPLLARLTSRTTPLAGSVRSLRFEGGQLEVEAVLPSQEALAQAGDTFRSVGLSVAMLDTQPAGGGTQVRLAITAD